jgi:hypothetical protein
MLKYLTLLMFPVDSYRQRPIHIGDDIRQKIHLFGDEPVCMYHQLQGRYTILRLHLHLFNLENPAGILQQV